MANHSTTGTHPHPPTRVYLVVWGWLFVLSAIAYFIDIWHVSQPFKAILLIAVALMKAGLIVAYFMHLRFERLNLIYAILAPLILLVAMVAGFLPDGVSVFLHRNH